MRSRVWLLAAIVALAACTSNPAPESQRPSAGVPSPSLEPSPTPEPSFTASASAFPSPVAGQAVYDQADVLTAAVEASLEAEIDAIEARSGAQVVVYLQVDPTATEESNTAAAGDLMDQWGIGRTGIDDGFVILVSFDETRLHGKLSTFAGVGLLGPLSLEGQASLRDDVIAPSISRRKH